MDKREKQVAGWLRKQAAASERDAGRAGSGGNYAEAARRQWHATVLRGLAGRVEVGEHRHMANVAAEPAHNGGPEPDRCP